MSVDADKNVKMWELSSDSVISTYNVFARTPVTGKYSKDGSRIAIGYIEQTIHIVNALTRVKAAEVATGQAVEEVDWNEDSTKFLDCGMFNLGNVRLASTFSTSTVHRLKPINSCKFMENENLILGVDTQSVEVYNAGTTTSPFIVSTQSTRYNCVDRNMDNSWIIVAGDNGRGYAIDVGTSLTHELMSIIGSFLGCAYSRASDYFAFSGDDNKIYLFDASNNSLT